MILLEAPDFPWSGLTNVRTYSLPSLGSGHIPIHAALLWRSFITHVKRQALTSMSLGVQVQAAVREQVASRSPAQTNGTANGTAQPQASLSEGARTTLLYIRFRAAAEPGLKGE